MTQYVLREDSRERKRPLWFQQMTGIGPMTTGKLEEAMVFASKDGALAHPCHRFSLTFFTPEIKRKSAR